MEQISTSELLNQMEKPEVKILDLRPVDAYNGWRQQQELRGGHIKGAKSLPAKWSQYIDWIEIVRSKNIMPENTLILYGYDKNRTEQVAKLFQKAGYSNIKVYHHFSDEWSANKELPMESLKRFKHLVYPKWLFALISNETVPEYDNRKFVICHTHYRNREDYEKGHIPDAIDLDTNSLETTGTWNRRSSEELKKALEDLGITYDTTVILYGRFSYPDNNDPFPGSSAGHLAAFRCAFIMLYAGILDVRILNGGLHAWIESGFETTSEETEKQPVDDFGREIPSHPEFAVDLEEAKEIPEANGKNLVSVRSWREYIGEVSGYNYIRKKGRIPGSVFANCGSDAYHMDNYRNLDHTTREHHEIAENWKKSGITPDKHNAFYCGTGWRGSEAFFNAWLMGWPHISVFDGGWFEWSNNNYPYETGIPKK